MVKWYNRKHTCIIMMFNTTAGEHAQEKKMYKQHDRLLHPTEEPRSGHMIIPEPAACAEDDREHLWCYKLFFIPKMYSTATPHFCRKQQGSKTSATQPDPGTSCRRGRTLVCLIPSCKRRQWGLPTEPMCVLKQHFSHFWLWFHLFSSRKTKI